MLMNRIPWRLAISLPLGSYEKMSLTFLKIENDVSQRSAVSNLFVNSYGFEHFLLLASSRVVLSYKEAPMMNVKYAIRKKLKARLLQFDWCANVRKLIKIKLSHIVAFVA